jgi:predicted nucleic acid-binding protein
VRAVIDINVLVAALLWRGPPLPMPVCRDPDDDQVLALALAAKVDLVISGDDDLLSMKSFEGIPILTPAEAVARIV